MPNFTLSLSEALKKATIDKPGLKAMVALDDDSVLLMEKRGVTLAEAEVIAVRLGYHPTELWSNWLETVINVVDCQERGDDDCCY
jgi:hypothetical protein